MNCANTPGSFHSYRRVVLLEAILPSDDREFEQTDRLVQICFYERAQYSIEMSRDQIYTSRHKFVQKIIRDADIFGFYLIVHIRNICNHLLKHTFYYTMALVTVSYRIVLYWLFLMLFYQISRTVCLFICAKWNNWSNKSFYGRFFYRLQTFQHVFFNCLRNQITF